jgi:hypothetical protein
MLKLDIGCGSAKRPQFIGIDVSGNPDVLCDVAVNNLPFDDLSVIHVHSSHCFEHITQQSLIHVFQEVTRVSANDGLLEFWHPHAFHGDAFVFGHINYLTEALYSHLGCLYRSGWKATLGAQWVIQEIRYGVEPFVIEDMKRAGIGLDFAVSYMHDVVKEMGVFIRVDRTDSSVQPNNYSRFVCSFGERAHKITQLSDGPRLTSLP